MSPILTPGSMTPEISVILPAYNEQDNIKQAVSSITGYLKKRFKSFEIIVVNDGSTDSTARMIPAHVKVINHSHNLGYGATLGDGFRAATGKLIFYTDADNQYDIAELDQLLPLIKKHDIVSGFRTNHADSPTRIFVSRVYNLMIRILLNLNVKDVDCSFKLYRRRIFDTIEIHSQTGLIDAEILKKALLSGFSIAQVGVTHHPRTKGHSIYNVGPLIRPSTPINLIKELIRLWPELTSRRK